MPTAFDQQDLDATMAQIKATMTAETEERSSLGKALDIITSLIGAKRLGKTAESAIAASADAGATTSTTDETLHKSASESHVHVHMHNGESADDGDEDDAGEDDTAEEDTQGAALVDAFINDILAMCEKYYANQDTGGAAMDKSRQEKTEGQQHTQDLVKSLLRKSLEAQTTHGARITALETSQAGLLQEMQAHTQIGSKHTDALETLGKAMLQLSTTQEAISKSLATLAEAQDVRDTQPQPSRYEAARQGLPGRTGQRIAQGFDKKRAVEALSKGLISLHSQEYRDWKYGGVVPEAVQHPLG